MDTNIEFEQILRRTQLQIRAFIRSCGVPVQDVDDLAQEVYYEYYSRSQKRPPHVEPLRWLKGIARRMCLNYFKRSSLRESKMRQAIADIVSENAQSRWEEMQAREDVFEALRLCLEKLSRKNRKMITLRYEGDLVSEEIGKTVSMTAASVRKVLQRLRGALKDCVTEALSEDGTQASVSC